MDNAAHVNGNYFADIGWNIGCTVANLFKDRDKELGLVLWFQTFVLHHLQNGQQTSNAALVVDETGFEEAAFGDNCLWIIADVVAHLDAQIENVLFAVNLLVDADHHAVLFSVSAGCIWMNVYSCAFAQDGAGVNSAISGVDAAVFTVEGRHNWTTDFGEFEVAVRCDGTNHQTKCVHMSGHHNSSAVVLTFDGDDAAAFFDLLKLVTQFGCDLLYFLYNCVIIATWTIDAKDFFYGVKKIFLVFCYIKNIHD